MICKSCEERVTVERWTPGSLGVEILLWLFFLLPGLIYSVWRLTGKKDVCSQCKGSDMVTESSAAGRRILTANQSRDDDVTLWRQQKAAAARAKWEAKQRERG